MGVRTKNPDRVAAKVYADMNGYFWLPCPRCGEWFGGHEWGVESVPCQLQPDAGHGACCPKISDENDAEACRRGHEMHGEATSKRSAGG